MEINQCPRCRTRFRGDIKICPVDGEALERLQDPLLGRTIAGRYLVEDKIGGGGMGVVYRASHQVIGRDVAIKFLHERYMRDATSRKRFLGEARAANQINHENIIDITDFGETEDGLVYLVMEYLHGRGLDQEIAQGPLPAARALRIASQVAAGLARAHELDVIHRDVKPANVFLVRRRGGEGDLVKLLDFGVARFERELRITDQGTLLGTAEYIAPEQLRSGEIGPKTDLYALGCVLFEMLVGRPPFSGNMTEVLVKQMRDAPPVPSSINTALPKNIDALVLKMLSKEPERRHRDAYHLLEELRAALETLQPSAATTEPTTGTQRPPSTRPPDPGKLTLYMPAQRDDDWTTRVKQYRAQLAALHPDGGAPAAVRDALAAMEKIVAEAALLRSALTDSAKRQVTEHDELRNSRLRIGRALDELASDESKLARSYQAEEATVSKAKAAERDVMNALLARPSISHIALKRGAVLSEEDALLLQGLSMILDKVRATYTYAQKLDREHAAKRVSLEDLRFQIEQLKARLNALNNTSSANQSESQERVQDAETKLRDQMERLVGHAEQVALYLRSHGSKPSV